MIDSPEAHFAIEAVREASLLARRIQREMVSGTLSKDDRSPVTVADFAVQAVVARRLAESLPGSTLIGEENADALRLEEGVAILDQITDFVRSAVPDATPEEVCNLIDRGAGEPPATYWTLDPIDGTKGFLRREQYAVALALVRNGKVELGVLGCPELTLITQGIAPSSRRKPTVPSASPRVTKALGTRPLSVNDVAKAHRLTAQRSQHRPHPSLRRKIPHQRRRNQPTRNQARHN